MPLWAADVAMNCPLNWRAVPTAWPIEAAMRRLEVRAKADADAERQRRAEVEAERQRLGTPRRQSAPDRWTRPDDKAQTSFTDPELQIMRTNKKAGVLRQCPGRVWMRPARSSWRVTSPLRANDKQQAEPMARLTVAALEQAGIAPQGRHWRHTEDSGL